LPVGINSCVFITPGEIPSKIFSNDVQKLVKTCSDADIAWVNCIVSDVRAEAEELSMRFGFDPYIVKNLNERKYGAFYDCDTQIGLMLPSIQVKRTDVRSYPVMILLRYGLVLTIQDRHITRFSQYARYAETHMRKIPANWNRSEKITSILIRLIDENNERNYHGIREMGGGIDRLSKLLANKQFIFDRITKETYGLKHRVVQFQTMLWENCDVMRDLQHGDAMLISSKPEFIERFDKLVDENTKYLQIGENLTNMLGSGSEAIQDYHAIYLLKYNNVLSFTSTWLGILGTIFLVPNTIATAMANTAYPMGTQDVWWYSTMLVLSTLISCYLTYRGFQRIWKMTRDQIEKKWALKSSVTWQGTALQRRLFKKNIIQGTEK